MFDDFEFIPEAEQAETPTEQSADLNGDGYEESIIVEEADATTLYVDNDMDGVIDEVDVFTENETVSGYDLDGDGELDYVETLADTTGDGNVDTVVTQLFEDGSEYRDSYYDADGDGELDAAVHEEFLDTTGDGAADMYIRGVDADGDGHYEMGAVYEYDMESGEINLVYVDEEGFDLAETVENEELGNYDPELSDDAMVSGNPEDAMDHWEFQGDTGRCAIYSQLFVIEELTGMELDADKLASLATENGWFTEEDGTPIEDIGNLVEAYGIPTETSQGGDITDIEEALDNGQKVIVAVDSGEIWYGEADDLYVPDEGADHAVEVIGIDRSDPENPMVILNDSGTPDGKGETVPLDTFMNAWADENNYMVVCG